jgi:hypothetical protein
MPCLRPIGLTTCGYPLLKHQGYENRLDHYFARPCVVCKTVTDLACSDCAIESRGSVFICSRRTCRDSHEATHNANREAT